MEEGRGRREGRGDGGGKGGAPAMRRVKHVTWRGGMERLKRITWRRTERWVQTASTTAGPARRAALRLLCALLVQG